MVVSLVEMFGVERDFLISQVLAFLAFVIGASGFQLKDKRQVLLYWAASSLTSSLHFLVLGRVTPAVITVITGARFLLAQRSDARWKFYFFITVQSVAVYLTFGGPISLLPYLASVVGTVAVFFFSNANLRIAFGVCSLIWIVHNYLVGSPVAVITEIIFLTSNVIGFLRLRKRWLDIEAAHAGSKVQGV